MTVYNIAYPIQWCVIVVKSLRLEPGTLLAPRIQIMDPLKRSETLCDAFETLHDLLRVTSWKGYVHLAA